MMNLCTKDKASSYRAKIAMNVDDIMGTKVNEIYSIG